MVDDSVKRPDPIRGLWYAFGGNLPERYHRWVLHDLTCRTWPLRHLIRAVVQVAPVVAALLILMPRVVPMPARIAAVVAGVLLGLLYSAAYMYEICEHRVVKAGYPRGTAQRTREREDAAARAASAERYAAMWRHPADDGPSPLGRRQR
jgi:hypothetical protein